MKLRLGSVLFMPTSAAKYFRYFARILAIYGALSNNKSY